jgi:hypothetical protein
MRGRSEGAEVAVMVGERRGEDRSRTGEYGGTVRTPSTPARVARSALAVGTLVNSPG